jgi:hypothetical protein
MTMNLTFYFPQYHLQVVLVTTLGLNPLFIKITDTLVLSIRAREGKPMFILVAIRL